MVKAQKKVQQKTKERKFGNLFESTPKNFKLGGTVQPKRDMTRFVKWPRYIVLQRQRRILYKRLKVPAVINQFTNTLSVDKAKSLFKLLGKYKPETKAEKKARLLDEAEKKKNKEEVKKLKPKYVKCGLNHVTTLVEQRTAKLVVIAHDVDPIELVLWLPHLCRNKGIPYCFVKSKARLGQMVNKKSATCLALTEVRKEDQGELDRLTTACLGIYNNDPKQLVVAGEITLGGKAQARLEKLNKLKEKEVMQNSK
jgi:large subunit ribosomal protein L7Ae